MRLRFRFFLTLSSAPLLAWACTSTTAGLPDFSFDAAFPIPTSDGATTTFEASADATPPTPLPVSVRAINYRGEPAKARVVFSPLAGVPYQRALDAKGVATSDPTLLPLNVVVVYECDGTCATAVAGAEPGDFIEAVEEGQQDYSQANVQAPIIADAAAPQPSYYTAFDGCYPYGWGVAVGPNNAIYPDARCTKKAKSEILVAAFEPNQGTPIAFAARELAIIDGGPNMLDVPAASWQPPGESVSLQFANAPAPDVTQVRRAMAFARGTKAYLRREFSDAPGQSTIGRVFQAPPPGFADSTIYLAQTETFSGGKSSQKGVLGRTPLGAPPPPVDLTKLLPTVGPIAIDLTGPAPRATWTEAGKLDGTVGFARLQVVIQTDAGTTYAFVNVLFPHKDAGSFSLEWLKAIDSGAVVAAYPQGLAFFEVGSLGYKALREHPSRIFDFVGQGYAFPGQYAVRYVVAEQDNNF